MATKKMSTGHTKTGGATVVISAEKSNRVQHGAMSSEKSSPSIKKSHIKS